MKTTDPESLRGTIAQMEQAIQEQKKHLTALRRGLPDEVVSEYEFVVSEGVSVRLSELFDDRKELIVIHNMGRNCAYCTMWADGFNGLLPHLGNRAAFVLTSPDDPADLQEFARSRLWLFRTVSCHRNTFAKDMGFRSPDGGYLPGVSAFRREDGGRILRTGSASFGPGDDFCSVWHLFDLLPEPATPWRPRHGY